jgi:hypothetical protein
VFSSVAAGPADRRATRPGDDLIARPDVVMDRAFTVAAPPAAVWPWLVQLGKKRAGWYLPAAAERFLPPGRRAARDIRPAWQRLAAGDLIPDYGGRDETFEVAAIEPGSVLVYRSVRGGRTSPGRSRCCRPRCAARPAPACTCGCAWDRCGARGWPGRRASSSTR